MTTERRDLIWQSSQPVGAATAQALQQAGAVECRLLTKAFWGAGMSVGFTHDQRAGAAYAEYESRLLNGLPGKPEGKPETAVPMDWSGPLSIDMENDEHPEDHLHDWRFTRWPDFTPELAYDAWLDVLTVLAWTRALRPQAQIGLFQFTDWDGSDQGMFSMLQTLHDACDVLEPGGYHLARKDDDGVPHPDLEHDAAIIDQRIETARLLRRRKDQRIRLWLWAKYQGGGLIPEESFRPYVKRVVPGDIDGAIVFHGNEWAPGHVRWTRQVLDS